MPLANDTQAEIDLLAGTAELRRQLQEAEHQSNTLIAQLDAMAQQRDSWRHAAEQAAFRSSGLGPHGMTVPQEIAHLRAQLEAQTQQIAGTAELRRELESVKHQRDTWQRMAETAARSVHDLTAERDNLSRALNATEQLNRKEADDYETKIRDLTAARDAALDQVRAMAHPPQIHTSPNAHAQELAKIQAAIPPRNRVDVHADFPAEALRPGDGVPRL